MINFIIVSMVIIFFMLVSVFVFWTFRDIRRRKIRQQYYEEFMKRKSDEKFHLP